jgi:hypothetical protein
MKTNSKNKKTAKKSSRTKTLRRNKPVFQESWPDTFAAIGSDETLGVYVHSEGGGGTSGSTGITGSGTESYITPKEPYDYPKIPSDVIISEVDIVPQIDGGGIDVMPKKDGTVTTMEESTNPNDGLIEPPPPPIDPLGVVETIAVNEPSPEQSKRLWLWLLLIILVVVAIIYFSKKK